MSDTDDQSTCVRGVLGCTIDHASQTADEQGPCYA